MVGQVVVRDSNGRGFLDDVDEPISTVRQRVVVHPDVGRSIDADCIAIAAAPQSDVIHRVPDHATTTRHNVVEVDTMDYDVLHVLHGDPCTVGDVDIGAPAVYRLMAGHDQLLLENNDHASCKDDPQWLGLDHSMPESALEGFVHFIVGGVSHHVDPAVPPSSGPSAEPKDAFSQLLAMQIPVWSAPPAPVDRVRRSAAATTVFATP